VSCAIMHRLGLHLGESRGGVGPALACQKHAEGDGQRHTRRLPRADNHCDGRARAALYQLYVGNSQSIQADSRTRAASSAVSTPPVRSGPDSDYIGYAREMAPPLAISGQWDSSRISCTSPSNTCSSGCTYLRVGSGNRTRRSSASDCMD